MFMHFKSAFSLSSVSRKVCVIFLAFSWISGLLAGLYAASLAGLSFFSMMRTVASSSVSFVGLCTVLGLPLLLSAAAAYFSAPALILPISFIKAFCFGYASYYILLSFGDAGWLIRLLVMFSSVTAVVTLIWFWVRHIKGSRDSLAKDITVCFFAAVIIGIVDYYAVSPFLTTLAVH